MTERLTPAQRRFLRSTARTRRPDVLVGKAGLAEEVIGHVGAMLDRHELVKVRLPQLAGPERAEAAAELAERASADLVDLVGRMVVLYRPNKQLPPDKRLHLPAAP